MFNQWLGKRLHALLKTTTDSLNNIVEKKNFFVELFSSDDTDKTYFRDTQTNNNNFDSVYLQIPYINTITMYYRIVALQF